MSAEEIRATVALLRSTGVAGPAASFPVIRLEPPDKAAVWSWSRGERTERHAFVVVKAGSEVREALVDLTRRSVIRVEPRPNVQTAIVPAEWRRATALVKADPRWQRAMRLRGITDFRGIFCDALSVGQFGEPERRRLLKVPCYDARGTTNIYGRPIEGLMALVDVGAGVVVEVTDSGPVPVSRADPSLEQERQRELQPALRPIASSAPAGFNFTMDDGLVRWAAWSFHIGFDQRVGPIVSTVRYRDGARERPVLYQGHISEMFVPYMDPDPNWAFRSYMDVGEYGFGNLASKLAAGIDCPAGAVMISATLPGQSGEPYSARDVMCVFERNTTMPLWRRSEIVTGSHEARQDVELVLRTIPTVGNYDYVYDWVFNRKGEIRIEVGATGIAAAKGVPAATADARGGEQPHGALIAPNLVAPYHDHYLSFRLDLDVDGLANSFVSERLVAETLPAGSARRSIWKRVSAVEPSELGIDANHGSGLWRVENRSVKTALGYYPSFEIVGGHNAASLLRSDDPPQRRAGFSARPLWVTSHKPGEVYAAGDYPNQSAGGEGIARFVDGEAIDGRDLVLWYTMGFHHVTRPEDWPVLATVRHAVTLRPHRFFAQNPALGVPREVDPASRERRQPTEPAAQRR
ncbi:hypothetical protein [Sphingomonas sp.]|uniref:copper amine oxidase n=1 Tax=Sphingomonas sp. TaxID=28214 RepID=UPI0017F9C4BD|nr:hypothetical protein [Sphingomonas sp.]MBA3510368.1 hypothetical protein [Sphingomonas sp.]